jgi:uncharacterized membrane-anchored protein
MMGFFTRIPRWLLFVLAGLIQVGLIALMVIDRASILREGQDVLLQTRPVDPRDFLRGDYVVLAYNISSVKAGDLANKPSPDRNAVLYVKLAPNADGFYEAVSVHQEPVPVTGREVLIRGRTQYGSRCGTGTVRTFCENLQMKYGIEKYFVPEGEGLAIESSRNEGKVSVVAAVTPSGRAAIKRLLIDGKPVYDEPLF